jgi:hypothetical protein
MRILVPLVGSLIAVTAAVALAAMNWKTDPVSNLPQPQDLISEPVVATAAPAMQAGSTRVAFHDIAIDQALEITEFGESYRKLDWPRSNLHKFAGEGKP